MFFSATMDIDEDDNPYIPRYISDSLQAAFDRGGAIAVKMLLSDRLNEWKESEINVGVTGNSGVGKSSFINALRGLFADDDGAAPVGVVETTMKPTQYKHPNNEQLLLWDLPGVGTPTYTRDEYLQKIEAKLYDYFIIISSNRFTENDQWLARELKRMNKKFYFVRTKISQDLENDKKSHPKTHDKNKVLKTVRDDCKKNLKDLAEDIYLIDNYEIDSFDFNFLSYKLVIDAPTLKREALLFTVTSFSEDMILAKRESLMERIHAIALSSAIAGAIPVPGLDIAVDIAVLLEEANFYKQQFGMSDENLKMFSVRIGVSMEELTKSLDLQSRMIQFTTKGIMAFMTKLGAKKMASYSTKKILKYILPGIGSLVTGAASYSACHFALESLLDVISQDALKIARLVHGN